GHLTTRFDCLGKEKARVKEIGERTVTLEMAPEQVANQPPRAPEEKSIPLYPTELPAGDIGTSADEPPSSPPQPIPPPPSPGAPPPARGPWTRVRRTAPPKP